MLTCLFACLLACGLACLRACVLACLHACYLTSLPIGRISCTINVWTEVLMLLAPDRRKEISQGGRTQKFSRRFESDHLRAWPSPSSLTLQRFACSLAGKGTGICNGITPLAGKGKGNATASHLKPPACQSETSTSQSRYATTGFLIFCPG